METRRSFLRSSALALAGGLAAPSVLSSCAGATEKAAPKSKEFIGLQTYSLGQELEADVAGGLARVKSFGYTDLELAGYSKGQMAGMSVQDFKKLCDDNGLKITSSHLGDPSQYNQPEAEFLESWKKTVEDHALMGCKWIVDPSQPEITTHEQAKLIGDRFNKAGEVCKAAGIQFGYHNHSGEFKKIATPEQIEKAREFALAEVKRRWPQYDFPPEMVERMLMGGGLIPAPGDFIEELFINNTDPSLVCFQLDCYWCVMGGEDPLDWLRKYPDRFKLLHVKDRWIIGASGMMNWKNIFNTAKEIGIHDWFVELEGNGNGRTQFEGVEESAKFLLEEDYVW